MSRSKKDIQDTEAMLNRLQSLGILRDDCESLRRISMTLRNWFEGECGNRHNHGSWAIVRGERVKCWDGSSGFVHDDDGKPFTEHHHYMHGRGKDTVSYSGIPDREAGARKRLAAIMKRYPTLQAYVQTDPRGCALYILRPGDVPEGADVSAYYSRGLAVFQ